MTSHLESARAGFTPPVEFDGYRLLRMLGVGGMGAVFLAQDSLLDRRVAVKFIRKDMISDAARAQFLIEAHAAARLQHPNVVTIHRIGEVDGHRYIISEYVRGQSLDRAPSRWPGAAWPRSESPSVADLRLPTVGEFCIVS